jgi:hypothetical protein
MSEEPKAIVQQTGWQFVGYYTQKKCVCQFPIGVYSQYCDGAAQANAWMKHQPNSLRWEGSKIYEELSDAEA